MLRLSIATAIIYSLIFVFITPIVSAESPYINGSVWGISLIQTEANMQEQYIKDLQGAWKKVMDAALEEGLILSYKVFVGGAANPDDWDVMLMVEFKNYAALDGLDEKFTTIVERVIGAEDEQIKMTLERGDIREIFGDKLMQEITIK
ncbi:MAG: hypothetical protein V3V99_13190 [candidate division Zixibacteria bacterium]